MTWHRRALALAAGALLIISSGSMAVAAPPSLATAASPLTADEPTSEHPTTQRLSGPTRYDTAAAVALTARPGAQLRLVSGLQPIHAAVARSSGRPTLLVPPHGTIPASITSAFRRLKPSAVTVVGSKRTLGDAQVRKLVGAMRFARLATDDPTTLSVNSAVEHASAAVEDGFVLMGDGMVMPHRPLASVAGAAQQQRFPLVLPVSGPITFRRGTYYPDPWWDGVIKIFGGPALSNARVTQFVKELTRTGHIRPKAITRAGGPDRFETQAQLAAEAFPTETHVVYLANGLSGVDAAAASWLADGPLLLVPPCGPLPDSVRRRLPQWRPDRVVAIGGQGSVCDDLVHEAATATTRRPSRTATALAGSGHGYCAIADGEVWCWGDDRGENRTRPDAPRLLRGFPSAAVAISSESTLGEGVFCAVDVSGATRCWLTRRGEKSLVAASETPRVVPGLESGVRHVSVSRTSACAVKADGSVWCWGDNEQGQLGDGGRTPRAQARPVPGITGATKVVVSDHMACALHDGPSLSCWGTWYQQRNAQSGESRVHGVTRQKTPTSDIADLSLGSSLGDTLLFRTSDDSLYRTQFWPIDRPGSPVWRSPIPIRQLLPDTDGCYSDASGAVTCSFDRPDATWLDANRRLVALAAPGYGCALYDDGGIVCAEAAGSGGLPGYAPSVPIGFEGRR